MVFLTGKVPWASQSTGFSPSTDKATLMAAWMSEAALAHDEPSLVPAPVGVK